MQTPQSLDTKKIDKAHLGDELCAEIANAKQNKLGALEPRKTFLAQALQQILRVRLLKNLKECALQQFASAENLIETFFASVSQIAASYAKRTKFALDQELATFLSGLEKKN